MLLSTLLTGIEVLSKYNDIDIKDIKCNSNENLIDSLFVCIRGTNIDGHNFAKTAIKNGALAIICEEDIGFDNQILVKNSRIAYANMCSNFFENKSRKLSLIATTGTNGKTSVSTIIYNILKYSEVKAGIISTIKAEYNSTQIELEQTTPDPYILHKIFLDMHNDGIKILTLEASSHALTQSRLENIQFKIGIFTNLTQDHLDYHKDMEDYYQAKKKLFDITEYAVINIDDEYGQRLINEIKIPYTTYSLKNPDADFFAGDILYTTNGVEFTLKYKQICAKVCFGVPGIHSVYNALAAIAACMNLSISIHSIVNALISIDFIKGRSEVIKVKNGVRIICDYAHTPDGLLNILKSTRESTSDRIILVFGCGGDRDKSKRELMGKIASDYSDKIVITSDNPRTEKPGAIISDIIKGIDKTKEYIAIIDRKDAIRYSIVNAKQGDTIILAGKGHEEYQILGDKKIYFDERKVVNGILGKLE